MDFMHEETDKMIKEIEKELLSNYKKAYATIDKKLKATLIELDFLNENDLQKRAILVNQSRKLKETIDFLGNEIANVNKISTDIITENLYSCYSENYNFGSYLVEKASGLLTGVKLFNRNAIKEIVKKNLSPFTLLSYNELVDKDRIIRALTREIIQSILLGESNQKLAKRIQAITNKNMNDSMRIARTEITRVENGGRQDAFEFGESLGLKLKKKWISTLDNRTRDSHLSLQGQMRNLDDTFDNGLMYPGATGGRAEEVVNCRCTHIVEFEGLEKTAKELELDNKLKNMTFKEWKKRK